MALATSPTTAEWKLFYSSKNEAICTSVGVTEGSAQHCAVTLVGGRYGLLKQPHFHHKVGCKIWIFPYTVNSNSSTVWSRSQSGCKIHILYQVLLLIPLMYYVCQLIRSPFTLPSRIQLKCR